MEGKPCSGIIKWYCEKETWKYRKIKRADSA